MRLAARGTRDLDAGPERVADPGERAALRRRARNVHVRSAVVAVLATALALAFRTLLVLPR